MKIARMVCAVVLLSCGAVVYAHGQLVKAVPANGSTLTASPANFVLTFSEPVKMTAVALQKDSAPAKKLGPLPTAATAEVTIPAPGLAPGRYVLSWRVVGGDGHVVPGKVSFTMAASGAATSARGATGN